MSRIFTDWAPERAGGLVALLGSVILLCTSLFSPSAYAVPSFARQTGLACAACHTVFPELTPFGRDFKMNGYTLNALPMQTVEDKSIPEETRLALNAFPPLSVMMQVSQTSMKKALNDSQPGLDSAYSQNNTVLFPQQLSLFYSGRISPNMGTFVQLTYDGVIDAVTIDNVDIRYANVTSIGDNMLTYGVTLNNNPSVQDPWNTAPAWAFPYTTSPIAPSPVQTMFGSAEFGQGVAGLGLYGGLHFESGGLLYGEVTLYRAAHPGAYSAAQNAVSGTVGPLGLGPFDSTTPAGNVQGNAPYYRLAYEQRWPTGSWEIGGTSFSTDTSRSGQPFNTPADKLTDRSIDTQYQHIDGDHIYSVDAIYIDEKQHWAAGGDAANTEDKLKSYKITGSYYYKRVYGGMLQYFKTTGTTDTGLYQTSDALAAACDPVTGDGCTPAEDIVGSANGSPNNDGWVAEVFTMPWENTRFALQYTYYNKFNGGKSNYNGDTGGGTRNASDNNTTYLLAWLMF
jgi:hypothetical protein